MKSINKNIIYTLVVLAGCFTACNDEYLNTLPTATVSTGTAFETTENAKMAMNGIARLMVMQHLSTQTHCGEGTIKFLFGEYLGENFSRPNLTGWATVFNATFLENATSTFYSAYPWYYYYMLLGNVNTFLANIDGAQGLESERLFLKAQALTYRAYCYTMLVQFYCYRWDDSNGGTSVTNFQDGLVLRTEDNLTEMNVPLSPSGVIYEQIYADLDEAIRLFGESGLTRDKVWEPNINVAYATYARAAITRQDYGTAADMAARARVGYNLMTVAEYESGFSAPNSEWIWGSYGGEDQTLFFYGFHSYMAYDANTSINRGNPVCISKTLYDRIPATDIRRQMFLDPGDFTQNALGQIGFAANLGGIPAEAQSVRDTRPNLRSDHLIWAYMSFKFSIGRDAIGIGHINHFRSSEMYLIEAEARYFQNQPDQAQALLNTLVRDSGRDPAFSSTATGTALLDEIKFYRAVELWGEGFDWLDKKRYNEPNVRVAFPDGNFFAAAALTRPVDHGNRWTYVTPLIERENNKAIE